ncbi:MAG: acyltransferase family protein [Beijerinckiaceae bacterium]
MSKGVESQNRLANLDLLRLVAAVMVVFYHYTYSGFATGSWNPVAFPELAPLTQHFWSGVSLFFIISGFVIAYSAQNRSAYDFIVSRIARLYPAFVVCLSITAIGVFAFGPVMIPELNMTMARWIAGFVVFSPALKQPFVDGAYWSIVVEIIFYLWVTLLIAAGIFQKRQLAIMTVWLAISLMNEFVLEHAGIKHLFTTRFAGYFVLGILTFRVFSGKRMPSLAETVIAMMAIVLSIRSDFQMHQWMLNHYSDVQAWSGILAVAKLLLMLFVINAAIRMKPVITPIWCATLGGLTYPLYLIHQNLGFVAFHQLHNQMNRWVLLAAVIAIMTMIAWLVLRYVEPRGRALIIALANSFKMRVPIVGAVSSR